jgi:hypothetical protein
MVTDPETFEINITTANQLIAQWGFIAQSIAQQCKWRPQGKCLAACQGLAVCNLKDLILVDAQGRPIGGTGLKPVDPAAAGYHPGSLADPRD